MSWLPAAAPPSAETPASRAGPSRTGPSEAGPPLAETPASGAGPSGAGPSGAGPSGAGPSGAGPSGAGPSETGTSETGEADDAGRGCGRANGGVAALGQRHALVQDRAQRGLSPGRDMLGPGLGWEPARPVQGHGGTGRIRLSLPVEPDQGSIHPAETHVGPEQGQADRRLRHQHVHQSGIGGVSLPGHRSIHAHNEHPCTAPGAAMGGSFPGIVVPPDSQHCQPIKRATVRQLVRPGERIRGQRTPVTLARRARPKHAGVARAVYEAESQRA